MTTLDDLKKRLTEDQVAGQPVLDLVRNAAVQVTVAELKAAVAACHCADVCPCCKSFSKGIRGFPDGAIFTVDKVDLQAVLDGCQVIHECQVIDGRKVRTKKLGPPHHAAAKPKPDALVPSDKK